MSRSEPAQTPEIRSGNQSPVLVIGGTGHVGAGLCLFLSSRGHPVTAASRSQNPVFTDSGIERLSLDVLDPPGNEHFPRSPMAVICPWVDQAHGDRSRPWIDLLLRQLVEVGTRSLIYLSSMWVYGGEPRGLLTESTPVAPTDYYGSAHARNEDLLVAGAAELGVEVSILRMANLVGPDPFFRHRTKVSFAHELMAMALFDRSIVLRSPPSTPRNLLPRTLFHHYLLPLVDRQFVRGRIDFFNMGGSSTSTMARLAGEVAAMAEQYHGGRVAIEHPEELNPQPPFRLDTTRIRALAGPDADDLGRELSMVLQDVVANSDPTFGRRGPT
ncbi:MAG: NAD(P)-dependent oxidoreductase [Acidimicrobiales bacterium]|nr:NAD(P)-dependent oxidoreductase [Acidimicrobiales bacterium]